MKERLVYIDRIKGFAIFLVVLGHVIQNNVYDATHNRIFQIIYSFHMPLFFFLSGYIAFKTTKINNVVDFFLLLKNKAISLLLPMIVWPYIRKYCFANENDFNIKTLIDVFLNEMQNPGLWFLKSLFEIFIIYSMFLIISNWLNKKNKILIDLSILLFTVIGLIVCAMITKNNTFISALLNYSFFMIGIFLFKYEFLQKLVQNKFIVSLSALLFVLIIGHYSFPEHDTVIMKALKVLISILAINIVYSISKLIEIPSKLDKHICLMGKNTLIIYVTHFSFFLLFARNALLPLNTPNMQLLLIAVPLSIVLMFLCVILGKIIAKLPFVNLLLYGIKIK